VAGAVTASGFPAALLAPMARLKLLGNALSMALTAIAVISLLGVSVLPNVLGYKTYVVLSGSMEPAIHTGSVVLALPVAPEALKVGDVIVYNRSDVSESITHRIIQVEDNNGKPSFVTKGDANGAPDSWTVQYNGNTSGKIVLAVPYLGYAYSAVGSPQGRLIFLIVPVIVLSAMWLAQIWRSGAKVERIDREVPPAMAPAPDAPASPPVVATSAGAITSKADPPPIPLRQ
jgi:signal peptidase I